MTLDEKVANIESAHGAHDEDDACSCFARLLAAVRGEPDPLGEGYRWPVLLFGCAEPPMYGCETEWDAMLRELNGRLAADVYRDYGIVMAKVEGLGPRVGSE